MPIIKDPIHNQHHNGQYGLAWCEDQEVLAVYDKASIPGLMRKTSGWYFTGTPEELNPPFIWCGIAINHIITQNVNPDPPGQQGRISRQTANWIGGNNGNNSNNSANNQWFQANNLTPPNGTVIYPLVNSVNV